MHSRFLTIRKNVMNPRSLQISILFLILFLLYLFPKATAYAAVWEAPYPLSTYFELIDFKYDYNPSINRVTMTYQYKNITGSTINSPRVVNLFLWSNDICSSSWEIMNYNGFGVFSNTDQSATEVDPDGYFNWHSLITSPAPPMDSNGMFPSLPTQYTQGGTSYPYWNICTNIPGQWADDEIATFSTTWTVATAYWIQSASWIVHCEGGDCPAVPDVDDDGVIDCDDNCKYEPNPGQEDTRPPGGNGCGDACECEGDFEPDGDVDGSDGFKFKADFFRKDCSTNPPCNGDFNCDGDVDGSDAFKFKADFFRKDCPSCVEGDYCVY